MSNQTLFQTELQAALGNSYTVSILVDESEFKVTIDNNILFTTYSYYLSKLLFDIKYDYMKDLIINKIIPNMSKYEPGTYHLAPRLDSLDGHHNYMALYKNKPIEYNGELTLIAETEEKLLELLKETKPTIEDRNTHYNIKVHMEVCFRMNPDGTFGKVTYPTEDFDKSEVTIVPFDIARFDHLFKG